MRKLRSTYVHRGDALRRRNRLKRIVAWGTVAAVALFVIANRPYSPPRAEAAAEPSAGDNALRFGLLWENRRLRREADNAAGERAVLQAMIERTNRIIGYKPAQSRENLLARELQHRVCKCLASYRLTLNASHSPPPRRRRR